MVLDDNTDANGTAQLLTFVRGVNDKIVITEVLCTEVMRSTADQYEWLSTILEQRDLP
jgi:hypothetical protein